MPHPEHSLSSVRNDSRVQDPAAGVITSWKKKRAAFLLPFFVEKFPCPGGDPRFPPPPYQSLRPPREVGSPPPPKVKKNVGFFNGEREAQEGEKKKKLKKKADA